MKESQGLMLLRVEEENRLESEGGMADHLEDNGCFLQ